MIKINKNICYIITLVFTIIGGLIGHFYWNKECVETNLFFIILYSSIIATYLMYIFSPLKKSYAYIGAFLSSVFIDFAFFWPFLPILYWCEVEYSKRHEAISDIVIDAYIFILLPIVLGAAAFSLIYWMNYYILKRKQIKDSKRGNINGN